MQKYHYMIYFKFFLESVTEKVLDIDEHYLEHTSTAFNAIITSSLTDVTEIDDCDNQANENERHENILVKQKHIQPLTTCLSCSDKNVIRNTKRRKDKISRKVLDVYKTTSAIN